MSDMNDPDGEIFRSSARKVGLQVSLLSGGMIIAGALLASGAMWWKATINPEPDPGAHYLVVAFEPLDLVIAAVIVGIGVVVLAGIAATWFTTRATAPLAEALTRQRNFVADASHELRTPLSVLHARIQQLKALTGNDPQLQPVVADLRQDSQELINIVDDLLTLAAAPQNYDAHTPLSPILTKVAEEQGIIAAQRAITVECSPIEASVTIPEVAVHRCLTALVSNAISHSPEHSTVQIDTERHGATIKIFVRDQGKGITAISPERVFERFARGTGGNDASHGIGLALVRDTVLRGGGSIDIESTGPTGTTFLLTMKEA